MGFPRVSLSDLGKSNKGFVVIKNIKKKKLTDKER